MADVQLPLEKVRSEKSCKVHLQENKGPWPSLRCYISHRRTESGCLAAEMTGNPLVHTVPAGEQLPEPHLPGPFIAGAGHWSVGAGRLPDMCVLWRGPACTPPTPRPGPWDAALWELGLSSDPGQDPMSLHSAPTVPGHGAPHRGLLSGLLARDHSTPSRGPGALCRDSAPPPGGLSHALLRGAPHTPWPLDSSISFSVGAGGPRVPAAGLPPQHQDMVDRAALGPPSSGLSSGRFCSEPVARDRAAWLGLTTPMG